MSIHDFLYVVKAPNPARSGIVAGSPIVFRRKCTQSEVHAKRRPIFRHTYTRRTVGVGFPTGFSAVVHVFYPEALFKVLPDESMDAPALDVRVLHHVSMKRELRIHADYARPRYVVACESSRALSNRRKRRCVARLDHKNTLTLALIDQKRCRKHLTLCEGKNERSQSSLNRRHH